VTGIRLLYFFKIRKLGQKLYDEDSIVFITIKCQNLVILGYSKMAVFSYITSQRVNLEIHFDIYENVKRTVWSLLCSLKHYDMSIKENNEFPDKGS
jgi:hypothetical protein